MPVTGLAQFAPAYDALLCDLWGVVHNGLEAHPAAVQALVNYRTQGGHVVFITNAPRVAAPIIDMLDALNVPRTAWDAVVSSGDTTRALIAPYRGRTIHHIGPASADDSLYEGLGVTRGRAEDAEAIVVTDLDSDNDTPDDYAARVKLWLSRGLPMICANPDKVVEVGEHLVYCGGALGDYYAERGGSVQMAGKPFIPIYEEALRLGEIAAGRPLDKARVLAIGDSVRTDAMGAAAFGIDVLFITGSVHAADFAGGADAHSVAALLAPSGARMAGFLPRLTW